MTLTELKAKCYDILAQLEYLQKELQETNKLIAEELNKEKSESEQ